MELITYICLRPIKPTTMHLHEAKQLAIELMDKHGLLDTGWHFVFDNAKNRFGVCKHRSKIVGLSQNLVALNSLEQVTDTILHEIAHALVGRGHGHDHVWRAKAIEIGCDGKRCYSSETVERPKGNYTAICPNPLCKEEYIRHKRPNGKKQSCGKCTRRFNPDTILVWVANK